MPEGDSVWRDAQRLRPVLEGKVLEAVHCRWPARVHGLVGRPVSAIRTHGKNLLLDIDTLVLRVHLRMTGTWRVFRKPGFPFEDLGLALSTQAGTAACYRVPVVERIDRRLLDTHPVLSRLGPDLLSDTFDPKLPIQRAVSGMTTGEVLLDQVAAAGIGNVYRAEILFLEGVNPWTPIDDVERPERLWARAARLMKANLRPGWRNTTGQRSPRLWVYGRQRKPCLRCGTLVRSSPLGSPPRTVYWCPRCQPRR